jgi:hypothetical protein
MRESRTYGSVRAKAEWLSYSTVIAACWECGFAVELLRLHFVDYLHHGTCEQVEQALCAEMTKLSETGCKVSVGARENTRRKMRVSLRP